MLRMLAVALLLATGHSLRAQEPQRLTNSIGMKLVLIPAGEFLMGSNQDDMDAKPRERPQHKVQIGKPFYLGQTEVTKAQWEAVTGVVPGNRSSYSGKGPNYPATHVTFDDAIGFCEKLSAREGKTYRLPTEAEWEYACRAGWTTKFSYGDDAAQLGDYAWYRDNSAAIGQERTHMVARKKPNAWGLYDMHGNVWEWCADWYDETYYENSPAANPRGPANAEGHVYRGGSWGAASASCRSAGGMWLEPERRGYDLGLRVVLEVGE